MEGKTRKILIADPLHPDGIEQLRNYAQTEIILNRSEQELARIVPEYHGLIVRSRTKVTKRVIESARQLVVIGRAGVGVDNIDVKTATDHGIAVVNSPTSTTIAVAEHTFGLMLALARNIPQAYISLRQGEWDPESFIGVELSGKVLGIVGLGRIGTEVARRAKGLDMDVVSYSPSVAALSANRAVEMGIRLVSLEELMKTSDFISIHCTLTSTTRGLIGEKEFSLAKHGLRLINCARGGVVDEVALNDALELGKVAGAAVDVFSTEPPNNNPILKNSRVIVTPHLGSWTLEGQRKTSVDIAEEVIAVLTNQLPKHIVNPSVLNGLKPPRR